MNHPSWWGQLQRWLRIKKLEYKVRESQRLQKFCERNGCKNLAGIEAHYQNQLIEEIQRLKWLHSIPVSVEKPLEASKEA